MFLEVLVFVQGGCPACHSIRQLVDAAAMHYGACVRTRVVDVNREPILSDTMQIQETPTIVGSRNYEPVVRMVGAEDAPNRLGNLYQSLIAGASCPVDAWHAPA